MAGYDAGISIRSAGAGRRRRSAIVEKSSAAANEALDSDGAIRAALKRQGTDPDRRHARRSLPDFIRADIENGPRCWPRQAPGSEVLRVGGYLDGAGDGAVVRLRAENLGG